MLGVVVMAGTCFVWAVRHFPIEVGAGVLFIVAVLFLNAPNVRLKQALIRASVDDALHRAYAALPMPPKLVMSSSYGFPAFEVSFESKRDMEAAATCNAAFKEEIAVIFKSPSWHKGWGPFFRPFSADQAIFFTYDGYLEELEAHFRERNHSWKR